MNLPSKNFYIYYFIVYSLQCCLTASRAVERRFSTSIFEFQSKRWNDFCSRSLTVLLLSVCFSIFTLCNTYLCRHYRHDQWSGWWRIVTNHPPLVLCPRVGSSPLSCPWPMEPGPGLWTTSCCEICCWDHLNWILNILWHSSNICIILQDACFYKWF